MAFRGSRLWGSENSPTDWPSWLTMWAQPTHGWERAVIYCFLYMIFMHLLSTDLKEKHKISSEPVALFFFLFLCVLLVWREGASSGGSDSWEREEPDDRTGMGESVRDEPRQESLSQPLHKSLPHHSRSVLNDQCCTLVTGDTVQLILQCWRPFLSIGK